MVTNCSFGVNTSLIEDTEVKLMQEQVDLSKLTECQLLSELENMKESVKDSKALSASLEDRNHILLKENQTCLATQLDLRSRVEELEVQINELKGSHQKYISELQDEKRHLTTTLTELEAELIKLNAELTNDKAELDRANTNVAELQNQLNSATNKYDSVSLELNQFKGLFLVYFYNNRLLFRR